MPSLTRAHNSTVKMSATLAAQPADRLTQCTFVQPPQKGQPFPHQVVFPDCRSPDPKPDGKEAKYLSRWRIQDGGAKLLMLAHDCYPSIW